jgi:hypothetical protein
MLDASPKIFIAGAFGAFLVGFLIVIVARRKFTQEQRSDYLLLILTFIGTFAGVLLAFGLENLRMQQNEINILKALIESAQTEINYRLTDVNARINYAKDMIETLPNAGANDWYFSREPLFIPDLTALQDDPEAYKYISPKFKFFLPALQDALIKFSTTYQPETNDLRNLRVLRSLECYLTAALGFLELEVQLLNNQIGSVEQSESFSRVLQEMNDKENEIMNSEQ